MATWKKVIVSGSVAELSASLYRAPGQPLQQVTDLASTTVLSGSFSGSFAGDGAGLTNIPYSSLTGAPEGGGSGNLIASGSLTASFTSNNGTPVNFTIVSGSTPTTLLAVSSSGIVSAGETFTIGNVTGSRSFLTNVAGINYVGTTGNITANTVQSWIDGHSAWDQSALSTYITADTPLADILYFLLTPYAASFQTALPNTKTFGPWSTNSAGTAAALFTNSYPNARVPNGSGNDAVLVELQSAGWHTYGGKYLFGFPTTEIYTNLLAAASFPYFTVTSTAFGSSNNTSPSLGITNAFGPGLLDNGASETARTIWLSASFDYKSYTGTGASISTFSSSSLYEISKNTLGSSVDANGLYYNKVDAAVSPKKYTDMYFSGAPLGNNFRYKYQGQNTGVTVPTGVNALGYYEVSASLLMVTQSNSGGAKGIPISPSSEPATTVRYKRAFYVPNDVVTYNSTTLSSNFTSYAASQISNTISTPIAGTIASSSLSGAPYITSASFAFSESIQNVFRPLYNTGTIYTPGASSITGPSTSTTQLTVSPALATVSINATTGLINTEGRI